MAVVLMGIWTGHFLGGFAWKDDAQHQFNWHPLLMTIALIFLYGNGKIDTRGLFHKRVYPQLLLPQIPKAQKAA